MNIKFENKTKPQVHLGLLISTGFVFLCNICNDIPYDGLINKWCSCTEHMPTSVMSFHYQL